MEQKHCIHISNLSPSTSHSNIETNSSISFVNTTPTNSATSSLDQTKSNKNYFEKQVISQPTVTYKRITKNHLYYNIRSFVFSKLLSEPIKQAKFETRSVQEAQSIQNRIETNIIQLLSPTTSRLIA